MKTGAWSLAIDFGTSNTAAAETRPAGGIQTLPLAHQSNLMPSAVFVRSTPVRSLDDLAVGDAALNAAESVPGVFVPAPKRLIGRPSVAVHGSPLPAVLPAAAVIHAAYRRALTQHNSIPPARVVLTHPEAWSPDMIAVLIEGAALAGIDPASVVTVSEPRAAVHYYTRTAAPAPGAAVAVFDFGGGTVDEAVLRATASGGFEVVTARGDNSLGGKNFDALIRRWAETQLADLNPDLAQYLRGSAPEHIRAVRALEESARRAKESCPMPRRPQYSSPVGRGAKTCSSPGTNSRS
ncbi:Hsp70 family protein [Rhodococcus chondri]|uniref:Hsp70 family protein n=1 Tax=Rhodococcus chondri TaxID=3065941 RepID=A0ABU7JYJ0_9NOCA|nr:Hsp70 family protein [Rhodococcus sp. CC-R104]MEE2034867.1 Hsp70 family protein [Rhodococcus sp. CC-R104]